MPNPNVGDLVASTIKAQNRKFADNFTNNNAALFWMQKRGSIKPLDGGEQIREELAYAANGNATSFDGYDTLPTGQQAVFDAADYQWKQYAVSITISGREKRQNNGSPWKMIDLVTSRINNARGSLKNRWCTDFYLDGTGNNGKNLTGLNLQVPTDPTSGTVGGINRANFTFFRSQIKTVTFAQATIIANMNLLWVATVRGTDKPQAILSENVGYTTYLSALQANIRFVDDDTADAGFENVKFNSAPVILDGGIGGACPASQMFFLNFDYLYWRPHTELNFASMDEDEDGRQPVNQDATIKFLGLQGNVTSSGLQFQGRFNGS